MELLKVAMKAKMEIAKVLFLTLFILVINIGFGFAQAPTYSKHFLSTISKKYGADAEQRILSWEKLITTNKNKSELQKLKLVNSFFNQLAYKPDLQYLGVEDYWMTPVEFLSSNGGECKDYAIAKYVTLVFLGVSADKLRITYVKYTPTNRAHMVLAYYSKPDAVPLILDNLMDQIRLATQRTDLIPVYSFNSQGLWLAQKTGSGEYVGSAARLSKWQAVIRRMQVEQKE